MFWRHNKVFFFLKKKIKDVTKQCINFPNHLKLYYIFEIIYPLQNFIVDIPFENIILHWMISKFQTMIGFFDMFYVRKNIPKISFAWHMSAKCIRNKLLDFWTWGPFMFFGFIWLIYNGHLSYTIGCSKYPKTKPKIWKSLPILRLTEPIFFDFFGLVNRIAKIFSFLVQLRFMFFATILLNSQNFTLLLAYYYL